MRFKGRNRDPSGGSGGLRRPPPPPPSESESEDASSSLQRALVHHSSNGQRTQCSPMKSARGGRSREPPSNSVQYDEEEDGPMKSPDPPDEAPAQEKQPQRSRSKNRKETRPSIHHCDEETIKSGNSGSARLQESRGASRGASSRSDSMRKSSTSSSRGDKKNSHDKMSVRNSSRYGQSAPTKEKQSAPKFGKESGLSYLNSDTDSDYPLLDLDEQEQYEQYQEQLYNQQFSQQHDILQYDSSTSSHHRQFNLSPLYDLEMSNMSRILQKKSEKSVSSQSKKSTSSSKHQKSTRQKKSDHKKESTSHKRQSSQGSNKRSGSALKNMFKKNDRKYNRVNDENSESSRSESDAKQEEEEIYFDDDFNNEYTGRHGHKSHKEFYNLGGNIDDSDDDDDDDMEMVPINNRDQDSEYSESEDDDDDDDEERPLRKTKRSKTRRTPNPVMSRTEQCVNRTLLAAFAFVCIIFVRDHTPWWKNYKKQQAQKSSRASTSTTNRDPMAVYNTNDDDSTHTRDHDPLNKYNEFTAGERISKRPAHKSLNHGFMDESYENRPEAKNSLSTAAADAGVRGSGLKGKRKAEPDEETAAFLESVIRAPAKEESSSSSFHGKAKESKSYDEDQRNSQKMSSAPPPPPRSESQFQHDDDNKSETPYQSSEQNFGSNVSMGDGSGTKMNEQSSGNSGSTDFSSYGGGGIMDSGRAKSSAASSPSSTGDANDLSSYGGSGIMESGSTNSSAVSSSSTGDTKDLSSYGGSGIIDSGSARTSSSAVSSSASTEYSNNEASSYAGVGVMENGSGQSSAGYSASSHVKSNKQPLGEGPITANGDQSSHGGSDVIEDGSNQSSGTNPSSSYYGESNGQSMRSSSNTPDGSGVIASTTFGQTDGTDKMPNGAMQASSKSGMLDRASANWEQSSPESSSSMNSDTNQQYATSKYEDKLNSPQNDPSIASSFGIPADDRNFPFSQQSSLSGYESVENNNAPTAGSDFSTIGTNAIGSITDGDSPPLQSISKDIADDDNTPLNWDDSPSSADRQYQQPQQQYQQHQSQFTTEGTSSQQPNSYLTTNYVGETPVSSMTLPSQSSDVSDNVQSGGKSYTPLSEIQQSDHNEPLSIDSSIAPMSQPEQTGPEQQTSKSPLLSDPMANQAMSGGAYLSNTMNAHHADEVKDNYKDTFYRWNHQFRPTSTDDDPGKDVPVFWRIPRSAGSTIEAIMTYCYGMTLASALGAGGQENDQNLGIATVGAGGQYVNVDMSNPAGIQKAKAMNLGHSNMMDAISTPFVYEVAGVFQGIPESGKCYTMLRHPVDRAVALYHLYQTDGNNPNTAQYRGMTIDQYAESSQENNWMVRFLTNKRGGTLTWHDLEAAKEVFGRKCLVGLLDKVEESLERYEKFFLWNSRVKNPKMKDECVRNYLANGNKRNSHPTYEGTNAWEVLRKKNEYDVLLFEYAKGLYDQQSSIYGQS